MRKGTLALAALCALYGVWMGVAAVTAPPAPSEQIGTANGPTLVTGSGRPTPGVLERYHANGTRDWRMAKWDAAHGTQRLKNGNILLAYNNYSGVCKRYDACGITGVQIWSPPPNASLEWHWRLEHREGRNREIHDANYYNDTDTVAVVDMEYERLVVIDRNTQDIVWQWNASGFYTTPPDPTKRDWLHINDVDRLEPGRYLISVRNSNQLLIIERGEGVVEVINKDRSNDNDDVCRGVKNNQLYGENLRCGDPTVLSKQHDPQWLGDGRVLVADSVNDRVVELERHDNATWEPVWSVNRVAGHDLHWPRDVNRLPNGDTLIADVRTDRVVQINQQKGVVWQIHYANESYAAVRNQTEYPAGPPLENDGADTIHGTGNRYVASLHGGLKYKQVVPVWFSEWHLLGGVTLLALGIGQALGVGVEVGVSRLRG